MPGSPLDPRCEGTNKLIKDGANILTSIDDVLQALNTPRYIGSGQLFETEAPHPVTTIQIGNAEREHVAQLLSPSPIETDDLIRESGLPTGQIITILLELELAGRAIRHAGGRISSGL